jgi:hypothetical protein
MVVKSSFRRRVAGRRVLADAREGNLPVQCSGGGGDPRGVFLGLRRKYGELVRQGLTLAQ